MTRDEAIIELKCAHDLALFDPFTGEQSTRLDDVKAAEALDMAIKALEAEPCEDCISREGAMNMMLCYGNEIRAEVMDDIKASIIKLPSVQPVRPQNPEKDREESRKYCEDCDHIEMCSWYPTDGCVWLKTDRYNAGYNAAKREIALSGEYERAYQRGKADARPKGKWIEYTRVILPEPYNQWEQAWYCSECGYGNQECEDGSAWLEWKFCPKCGADMREGEE